MNTYTFIMFLQLLMSILFYIYMSKSFASKKKDNSVLEKENEKEMEKLNKLRMIKLTEPLTEKSRPSNLEEIIGQEKGIKALKAALCGPNPQHVIIYGPPGVGKTAAARIILEEAKKMAASPFNKDSKFVEIDATTLRFDERGIADPLIGSVHDPIYQGAGSLGIAGVPQPKPGAVTKAHGGILFIDEIGELHPIELNKLLKVLEDRKVFLDSAYYSSEDPNTPRYIKEIKVKELPALDDEFAKEVSEFDTLEELKADLKEKAVKANELRAKREMEEKVINAVVDNAKVEIPEAMINREVENMVRDLEMRLGQQGLSLEQYYEFTGSTEDKMKSYMKENAERKVKTDLVMSAVTEAEAIEATEEELKAKAEEVAKMYSNGAETEKMVDLLLNAQRAALELDVKREKTLKMLFESLK